MGAFRIAQNKGIAVGAVGAPAVVAAVGGTPAWLAATVLAKIVGVAGAQVTFSLQGSIDDSEWFDLPFVDLTGSDEVALASSVTVAANGATVMKGIMFLQTGVPFLRFGLVGAGAGTAVVDITVVATM